MRIALSPPGKLPRADAVHRLLIAGAAKVIGKIRHRSLDARQRSGGIASLPNNLKPSQPTSRLTITAPLAARPSLV
jgi:hypothetical protein